MDVKSLFPLPFLRALGRLMLAALILHLTVFTGLAEAVSVKLGKSAIAPTGPGMRVVLVRAAGNCAPSCAEWISAEGRILPETIAEFSKVLVKLGRRKVPVFVHSAGGTIVASLAIGRMLRAHRLDVSVTHTQLQACIGCGDDVVYSGVPVSSGAVCASACAYLFAGGVRRYVSPGSRVGVHDGTLPPIVQQYTMVTTDVNGNEVEIGHKSVVIPFEALARGSERFRKLAAVADEKSHARIEQYNRDMGVAGSLAELAFATKPPAIHWMTRSELSETRLMTEAAAGETLVGISPGDYIQPTAGAVVQRSR